jgi:indole-3-glycerol phosphate synthase
MDELERLAANSEALIRQGYYAVQREEAGSPSFLKALGGPDQTSDVIAEIKFASPTMRTTKEPRNFEAILARIVGAKPLGLSVVTEPRIFGGHLDFVWRSARTGLPVLMKDIILDAAQIEAAAACGASAVLLIETLASRSHLHGPMQVLVDEAHMRHLEVVLEVHTPLEWDEAVQTDADILGINNRDLATMAIDMETTSRILLSRVKDRPVIAMSGVETRAQVDAMLAAGADAVLVGTSIMLHEDPAKKLQELEQR